MEQTSDIDIQIAGIAGRFWSLIWPLLGKLVLVDVNHLYVKQDAFVGTDLLWPNLAKTTQNQYKTDVSEPKSAHAFLSYPSFGGIVTSGTNQEVQS